MTKRFMFQCRDLEGRIIIIIIIIIIITIIIIINCNSVIYFRELS